MNLGDDDFTLFGLPKRHAQERAEIDTRWRQLQAEVHPDRFASEGAGAQRMAMQWAVRVNEAYARLKDPLARAAYLCELRGAAIDAERNTAMPPQFLMQQMEWRESLDEARDADAVEKIDAAIAETERALLAQARLQLDDAGDAAAAAATVRQLMFVRRFREDVDRRLAALES